MSTRTFPNGQRNNFQYPVIVIKIHIYVYGIYMKYIEEIFDIKLRYQLHSLRKPVKHFLEDKIMNQNIGLIHTDNEVLQYIKVLLGRFVLNIRYKNPRLLGHIYQHSVSFFFHFIPVKLIHFSFHDRAGMLNPFFTSGKEFNFSNHLFVNGHWEISMSNFFKLLAHPNIAISEIQ